MSRRTFKYVVSPLSIFSFSAATMKQTKNSKGLIERKKPYTLLMRVCIRNHCRQASLFNRSTSFPVDTVLVKRHKVDHGSPLKRKSSTIDEASLPKKLKLAPDHDYCVDSKPHDINAYLSMPTLDQLIELFDKL